MRTSDKGTYPRVHLAFLFLGVMASHSACNQGRPVASRVGAEPSQCRSTSTNDANLLAAVAESRPEDVARLLRRGANPNAVDALGQTPLYMAAHTGDIRSAKLLLKAGANVEGDKRAGCSPLYEAAGMGNAGVVRLLISKGADVEGRHTMWKGSALHRAAEEGHADTVGLLLRSGATVDLKNHAGQTALHRAAMWGNSDVIKVLLRHDASRGVRDDTGAFPWQITTDRGDAAAAQLLKDK